MTRISTRSDLFGARLRTMLMNRLPFSPARVDVYLSRNYDEGTMEVRVKLGQPYGFTTALTYPDTARPDEAIDTILDAIAERVEMDAE